MKNDWSVFSIDTILLACAGALIGYSFGIGALRGMALAPAAMIILSIFTPSRYSVKP